MTIAFTHALLIDGNGGPAVPDATVIVSGNRISAVGAAIEIPDGAQIIDLAGKAILPGLIDAHVHLGGLGFGSRPAFAGRQATDDYADPRAGALRYGVTTVRSLGDFLTDSLAVRDAIESGALTGPRIVTSGPSFQVEGGHPNGSVWFNDPQALKEAARVPKTVGEAKHLVGELADAGVDLIKIIISNNAIFGPAKPELKMPWEFTEAIITTAHDHNLMVATHTETLDDAMRAVQLGADDIEHLVMRAEEWDDPAAFDTLFDLITTYGGYLVPTMVAHQRDTTPETDARTLRYGNKLVKRAFDRGVKLGVGSDAHSTGMHGWRLRNELVMLVHDQGIPAADVLTAVTKTNAELTGMSGLIGAVEAGKLADLLIVDGNPLDDITAIGNVYQVLRNGAVVIDNAAA
ncbi:amidohydrolase family protein [Nocardia exalbida]|uniref:amidohydrolase family protein n=1 Tax=Nocardia exalbida TaxID=290231 RepID=UPI00031968FE|nr:amidohydrolase family protein [Nocardia exalbida]